MTYPDPEFGLDEEDGLILIIGSYINGVWR